MKKDQIITAPLKEEFEYLVRKPKSSTANKLVVLFHGYGYSGYAMDKMAAELQVRMPDAEILMIHGPEELFVPDSDDGNALKVPQSLLNDENKKVLRRQWFPINAKTLQDYEIALSDLSARLNKFIDQKRDELNLNDEDVAFMGFSQGGAVALYTAYWRENEIGCVVGHSTLFFGGDDLQSKPPTLFVYGTKDEEFSTERYDEVIGALKDYLGTLDTEVFEGLKHLTSYASRSSVSRFIEKKLS